MKFLKKLSCVLLSLLFIALASCSSDPYEFEYSSEHTAEFFSSKYESFDANLVYSSCAQYCNESELDCERYAAIKGVSVDDMVVKNTSVEGEESFEVVRRVGSTVDPLKDWKIKKAIIYWRKTTVSDEEYQSYGDDIVYFEEFTEKDRKDLDALAKQFEAVKSEESEKTYHNAIIIDPESNEKVYVSLCLRLYFEKCDTIYWDSEIFSSKGLNCIENGNGDYIALPSDFSVIVGYITMGNRN